VEGVLLIFPALRTGLVAALQLAGAMRPVAVLAERHRGRFLVRSVVVTSFVVAAVASAFGSSITVRDRYVDAAVSEINSRPPVPGDVLAVTYPLDQQATIEALGRLSTSPGAPAEPNNVLPTFTDEQVASIRAEFPDSTVLPVQHVNRGETTLSVELACAFGDCTSIVVADPRLDQIYGGPPAETQVLPFAGERGGIAGRRSAPEAEDVLRDRLDGAPVPAVTFDVVNTVQVDPKDVVDLGLPTGVRTIFLKSSTSYTAEDQRRLERAVAAFGGAETPVAVSSAQDSAGFVSRDYGDAPWAPKDPSTRWSIVVLAAALALVAAVGTSSIDAIDRWRDNQRLEVLGASARQVRGAAALHTWIELGLTALLAVGGTLVVLAFALQAFNANAAFPVPLVIPWLQLFVVAVIVPLGGAAIASLVARPVRWHRVERGAPGTSRSHVTVASS
jgi:hypothetical protein